MRRFLLSALLFLPLLACTPKQVPGPSDGATGDAAAAWNAYSARTRTEEATARPFRLSASLRYTDNKGESTRVSSLFWGNGRTPYPLRLDLTAGVGTVVAKIRENNDNFTAYNPDEKTAYFHTRENRALSAFGVPIPLTLLDLSLILTGRGGTLFLPPVGETPSAEAIARHSLEQADWTGNPPMFLLHAMDDASVPVENSLRLQAASRQVGVSCEAHYFAEGDHGFGLMKAAGLPVAIWPELLWNWLAARKIV